MRPEPSTEAVPGLWLDRSSERLRIQTIASRKLEELTARMRELRRVSRGLKSLVEECQSTCHGTPCPIIEVFCH